MHRSRITTRALSVEACHSSCPSVMLHSQGPIHLLLHEQLNNNIQTYLHSSTFFYDYRRALFSWLILDPKHTTEENMQLLRRVNIIAHTLLYKTICIIHYLYNLLVFICRGRRQLKKKLPLILFAVTFHLSVLCAHPVLSS